MKSNSCVIVSVVPYWLTILSMLAVMTSSMSAASDAAATDVRAVPVAVRATRSVAVP